MLKGFGAPFFIALSRKLAANGLYAWTHNPMELAGLSSLLSLGVWFQSVALGHRTWSTNPEHRCCSHESQEVERYAAAREAALASVPAEERLRIGETIPQVFAFAAPDRLEALVGPLRAAVRFLRHERAETRGQRVASVGEGLSALLACTEPELSGAVVFYGATPSAEKLAALRCPILAFYGAKDDRVNAGIDAFVEGARAADVPFEWHVYEGAGHGFFNDTKPAYYDVVASRDAFARLLMFLLQNLSESVSR
jgi:dienelactone hydrolase